MTQKLKHLRSYETSFVPRGANLKKFLILKEESEMAKSAAAQHVETLIAKMALKNEAKVDAILKELSPEDADALKAALKVLQALGDQVAPEAVQEIMELVGVAPADGGGDGGDMEQVKKDMMAYKERAEKAEAQVAKMGNPPPSEGGDAFPVKKDGTLDEEKIPASTRAMVKALWNHKQEADEKLAKVTKSLDEERDRRVTKEYEEIASSNFRHLPINKEQLGAVLKTIATKDPEGYKAVEQVLKAANSAVEKAGLTKELGSSLDRVGAAADDYEANIVAPAMAQTVAKEKGWGEDEAVTHFITKTADGRKAYAAYRNEQESAKRRA